MKSEFDDWRWADLDELPRAGGAVQAPGLRGRGGEFARMRSPSRPRPRLSRRLPQITNHRWKSGGLRLQPLQHVDQHLGHHAWTDRPWLRRARPRRPQLGRDPRRIEILDRDGGLRQHGQPRRVGLGDALLDEDALLARRQRDLEDARAQRGDDGRMARRARRNRPPRPAPPPARPRRRAAGARASPARN